MRDWLKRGSIRSRSVKYAVLFVLPITAALALFLGLQYNCLSAALLTGLVTFCACTLAMVSFSASITEPLSELSDAVRRIAEGSYGMKAGKHYEDEVGSLTDSINEISAKLGRAETLQSEFISSVSHELRTPLTAITGWSETLGFDEDIGGDSRRGIAIIAKEASRLTKMVEDLLEFTRIQDGRFKLNIQPVDVAAELEESLLAYGELLRREELELSFDPGEEDLPQVDGDPERLRQVFLNILDNAAKYGRGGGSVDVSIECDDGFILVCTTDHGPGIPEDELPHVKEKFYKGSSKERGNGIGLSVCDEIVGRHGGRLDVHNNPGGGVTVSVRLPVKAQ